jgi:hypothetical protein
MDLSKAFVDRLQTKRCSITAEADGSLLVCGASSNPYDTMEVTLPGVPVTQGDLVVFFEVMAVEPMQGFAQDDRIPRLITLHADGLPRYSDQRGHRNMYNDIMAYMGTPGFTPQFGYFRRAGNGRGKIDLTFIFQDQGKCRLRNLSLHNSPMAIIREFEKGVVLVNASEETVTFDLPRLIPDLKGARLQRIKADPEDYVKSPVTEVMISYNDGRREDAAHVEVPPLNGLFLEKVAPASPR